MSLALKRRRLHARLEQPSLPVWMVVVAGIGAVLAGIVALGIGSAFALWMNYTQGYGPIEERLRERYIGLTEVYDRNGPEGGVLLGTLANPHGQLLNPVPLSAISPWMIEATVSTEDDDFWDHPGVNPGGLARAARENFLSDGGVGSGTGGSSITQQLVKNVYLSDQCEVVDGARVCVAPRTIERKLKEIAYALELDDNYTKEQILGWYLNQISYADRYVGVEAAAQGYFRKSAKDLTLGEAALLAGIPAAPTKYHPRLNCVTSPDGLCVLDEFGRTTVGGEAKARQEYVLDLMVEHKRATPEQAAEAKAEVLKLFAETGAPKASAWIDSQVEPRLVRMCEAGILPKAPGTESCVDSVHSSGYKVTTTLDYELTQAATQLMGQWISIGLSVRCDCHNASIVTVDPATGQVLVYAPNIDPTWVSDRRVAGHIDQANEINQPGSSFKPAVYLAWFDTLKKVPVSSIWDTSPLTLVDRPDFPDQKVTITNPRPGGGGEGLITARAALGGSQNVPAFRAASEVGVPGVIEMAKKIGITTLEGGFDPTFENHDAIYYGPSVATGGANIRVIDMAYMDATIANMGLMVGVPTLAKPLDMERLKDLAHASGEDWDEAYQQKLDFQRGHTRLPGTRELDPVTVLEVRGIDGAVLYRHGADLQKKQVVNAGSVWMLHSIMSDCTARFIIWQCGRTNDDLSLDPYVEGVPGMKIPAGVKTGTQQGFRNATDTLETWMTGYSRYAGTALWVGNADNSLVRDGPSGGYAAANTTVRLFKHWMGTYHQMLKDRGVFDTPATFDELRPGNVVWVPYQTATTERGTRGGCSQMIATWVRTDIDYVGDCVNGGVPLPVLSPELAVGLAYARGIPIRGAGGIIQTSPTTPVPQAAVAGVTVIPLATPTPSQQGNPTAPRPTQAPTQAPQSTPTPRPTTAQPTPTQQSPPTQQQQGPGNGNGNGNGNGGTSGR